MSESELLEWAPGASWIVDKPDAVTRPSRGSSPTVLLTGGTGTFGRAFLERVLPLGWTVRVFSRDEFKQGQLREDLGVYSDQLRLFVGDVRDGLRLRRAIGGSDLVVHAAALKQVPSCEYNPFEAVKTNVVGSQNVVEAALDAGVPRSVLLSSDKAVHPVNVYGASKLCAEKCWLAANAYAGSQDVRFSAVRYGNVVGSRGSVLEKQRVRLTDSRATRFWMDVSEAVDLVLLALQRMAGGEVFVPKVKRASLVEVVPAESLVWPPTGLRPGEKLHERLVADEEVARTWDCGSHYVIADRQPEGGTRVAADFQYSSAA